MCPNDIIRDDFKTLGTLTAEHPRVPFELSLLDSAELFDDEADIEVLDE